jgi:TetR/AcrR family fatty acid metabolism transcriptional regulator
VHEAEQTGEDPIEQLRGIAAAMFEGWLNEPDVVRVVVREIARTEEIREHVGELVRPIGAIRRVIERGQAQGVLRDDLDASMAAVIFYGGIDELISGWVLGRIPGDADEVAAAEWHLVEVLRRGLTN